MIQLYFLKRNFDVQKAERFFKERRIPLQMTDLSRSRIGRKELELFAGALGLDALVDRQSKAWLECPARFSAGQEAVLAALAENPARLRLPLTRCGRRAAQGYTPEIWEDWIREEKK